MTTSVDGDVVAVRQAKTDELPAVMNVIDGGLLAVSADAAAAAIDHGDVLVATEDDRVLGAVVIEADGKPREATIAAIAVRPARRGQGIGSALVSAVAARHDRVVAAFDDRVRPFWASLGFEILPAEDPNRSVGILETPCGEG